MGMFDDLLPTTTSGQRAGMFDDLVDPAAPPSGPQYPSPQPPPETPAQRQQRLQAAANMVMNRPPYTPRPGFVERTVEDIRQNWPEYSGGTMGGILGSAKGAAFGSTLGPGGAITGGILGGVFGAAGGGAGGKGLELTATGQIGSEKATQEMLDAAARQGTSEFFGQAGGQVVGRAISGGFARGRTLPGIREINERINSVAKRLTDTGELSPALLQKAHEKGTFVPLSQGTQSRGLQRTENFVRGSYIGGGGLYDMNKINPAVFRQVVGELEGEFWDEAGQKLGSDAVGRMFRDAVTGKREGLTQMFADKLTRGLNPVPDSQIGAAVGQELTARRTAWRAAGSAKYQAVDDIIKTQGKPITVTKQVPTKLLDASGNPVMTTQASQTWELVDTAPIRDLAPKIMERAQIGGKLGSAPGLKRFAEQLASKPERMTFAQADALRSFVLEESRKLKIPLGNKSDKVASAVSDAVGAIDVAMDKAATEQGIDAMLALKDARNFWRVHSELDKSPFVQGLAKRSKDKPEQLARYVFVPRAPQQIKMARQALGDEAFFRLRDTWMSQTMKESLSAQGSIGNALRSQLDQMGPDALKEMFPGGEIGEIYRTADTFAKIGGKTFENDIIRSAAERAVQHPGQFIQRIFEPRNPQLVRTVRRVVGDDQFKTMRAAWLEDALRRSGDKAGPAFGKVLDDMGPTLPAMFSSQHIKSLREVSRMGEILNLRTIDASNILAPLVEAGAVTGMLTAPGRAMATSTVILGIPVVLGKILSNERRAYWLAEGLRHPEALQGYVRRIAADMVRYGVRPDAKMPAMPKLAPMKNLYLSGPKL